MSNEPTNLKGGAFECLILQTEIEITEISDDRSTADLWLNLWKEATVSHQVILFADYAFFPPWSSSKPG